MIASLVSTVLLLVSPQASPEMEKLSFFIGEWHSVETSTAPGRDPVEFTLDGTYEWTLGGAAIKIDETLHLPGDRKSHNFIILMWDAGEESYVMNWFFARSATPMNLKGNFDGSKLIFVTDDPDRANPMRITYDPQTEKVFKASLEIKVDDEWQTRTLATYTKQD